MASARHTAHVRDFKLTNEISRYLRNFILKAHKLVFGSLKTQLKLLGFQIVHLVAHTPEKTAEMPTTAAKENGDRLRSFKNKGKDQDVSLRAQQLGPHLETFV